jgi:Sulfotransferase family
MSIERYFTYPTETIDYVVNVSEKYRYMYLANLKVASSSILRVLQLAEVDGDASRLPESPHDRAGSPIPAYNVAKTPLNEVIESEAFFKFTYVRNPYTRVLSAYLDKVLRDPAERLRLLPSIGLAADSEPTFLEFLKAIQAQRDSWRDIHWVTQSRLVQINNINYNFIGRFESFVTTFPAILELLGIDHTLLAQAGTPPNVTRASDRLREFIGPKEREVIIAIYEADFLNFRYSLDPRVARL